MLLDPDHSAAVARGRVAYDHRHDNNCKAKLAGNLIAARVRSGCEFFPSERRLEPGKPGRRGSDARSSFSASRIMMACFTSRGTAMPRPDGKEIRSWAEVGGDSVQMPRNCGAPHRLRPMSEEIKRLRERRGLSLEKLASTVGLAINTRLYAN